MKEKEREREIDGIFWILILNKRAMRSRLLIISSS